MTDDEFLEALESCKLPPHEFTHVAHIRAGYLYLRAGGFAAALQRIRSAISNYAAHLGRGDKYNETITVAYLSLINQHMSERGAAGGWPEFVRENPQLLDRNLLLRYYDPAELHSDLARRAFLLPRMAGAGRPDDEPC